MALRKTSIASAVFAAAAVILAIAYAQRIKPTVLGDFGTQPETAVTRLNGNEPQELGPVIASAKACVADFADRMWPEPSQIVERDDRWEMWFANREKRVKVGGQELISKRDPAIFKVEVSKKDHTATLIPGR